MEKHIHPHICSILRALSHPVRLQIVEHLSQRPYTVGELARLLALRQPAISQHLAVLIRVGVLLAEPKGNYRCYRLRGPRLIRILSLLEEFCHVHRLGDNVNKSNSPTYPTDIKKAK